MIAPALKQMERDFQALLDGNALGGKVSRVDATPRRLALFADGLVERQADKEELAMGPPKSAGAGAAAGFAKKMGTTVDALGVEATAKGEYFSFRKKVAGRAAADVLAEALPGLILGIAWPKTMYWTGKSGARFIRPIRWLVALLDDAVAPFEIAGVKTGNRTWGHRLHGNAAIPVTIGDYEARLEEHGVILSAEKRRERIEKGIAALLAGTGMRLRESADLLDTLVYLTEYPTAILGEFHEEYLELPREILSTVMRHHQKYFSVENQSGALAPRFVAVMNTSGDPDGLVKHGNERVLRARFNDARFFWENDLKRKLEDRLEDLKSVTFQAKLGSYYDKTLRVVELVKELGGDENAQRAARLAKCDLTTDMVKEFTDLQGVVGGLYAEKQGEAEGVARAIYTQYKPVSMEDEIPGSEAGQMVALADKLDTLRECFRVGMMPSGSKDPFGLRRAAQGVVRILAEGQTGLPLREEGALGEFFADRVKYYFREVRGYKYDEVNAVMAAGWERLPDVEERLRRVKALRPTPGFEAMAASFKRIKNILKQAEFSGGGAAYREELLEAGAERDLHAEMRRTAGEAMEARIGALRPAVDRFFDEVLVNAEDARVRTNRLTLLSNLLTEFSTIADFSEIVTDKA